MNAIETLLRCEIARGSTEELPGILTSRFPAAKFLLLADEETALCLGEAAKRLPKKLMIVLKEDEDALPLFHAPDGVACVVGAGRAVDAARYFAAVRSLPFVAVCLSCAPAGLAGKTAEVRVGGKEVRYPVPPPALVYADEGRIKAAKRGIGEDCAYIAAAKLALFSFEASQKLALGEDMAAKELFPLLSAAVSAAEAALTCAPPSVSAALPLSAPPASAPSGPAASVSAAVPSALSSPVSAVADPVSSPHFAPARSASSSVSAPSSAPPSVSASSPSLSVSSPSAGAMAVDNQPVSLSISSSSVDAPCVSSPCASALSAASPVPPRPSFSAPVPSVDVRSLFDAVLAAEHCLAGGFPAGEIFSLARAAERICGRGEGGERLLACASALAKLYALFFESGFYRGGKVDYNARFEEAKKLAAGTALLLTPLHIPTAEELKTRAKRFEENAESLGGRIAAVQKEIENLKGVFENSAEKTAKKTDEKTLLKILRCLPELSLTPNGIAALMRDFSLL